MKHLKTYNENNIIFKNENEPKIGDWCIIKYKKNILDFVVQIHIYDNLKKSPYYVEGLVPLSNGATIRNSFSIDRKNILYWSKNKGELEQKLPLLISMEKYNI